MPRNHAPLLGALAVVFAQEVEGLCQPSGLLADAYDSAVQGSKLPAALHGLPQSRSTHDIGIEPFEQGVHPLLCFAFDQQPESVREVQPCRQQGVQFGVEHLAPRIRKFTLHTHILLREVRWLSGIAPVRRTAPEIGSYNPRL